MKIGHDKESHYKKLFDDLKKGNLSQGWLNNYMTSKSFSEELDKSIFLKEYDRISFCSICEDLSVCRTVTSIDRNMCKRNSENILRKYKIIK